MLTFDAASHVYHWKGQPVPNVTLVLKPFVDYGMVNPEALEVARQRGVAVHRMVELWAKNDLEESTLPEWMQPVYRQWLKFVDDTGLTVLDSEQKVFHPLYQYAGTFDLIVTMRGKPAHGLIDIKRSFMAGAAIGLQTAAYAEAENAAGHSVRWRGALKLREDGAYRYQPFDDPADFSVFIAALKHYTTGQIINQWKEKNCGV